MMGGGTLPQADYDDIRTQVAARVRSTTDRVIGAGIEATGITAPGAASEAIFGQAEAFGADLIVIGTRRLRRLKHVMRGSVAGRVVGTAPCPVLTATAHSQ